MTPHRRRADQRGDGAPAPAAPAPGALTTPEAPAPGSGLSGGELIRLLRSQIADRRPGEVVGLMRGHLDGAAALADGFGPEVAEVVLNELIGRVRGVVRTGDRVERYGRHGWVAVVRGLPARRDLEQVAQRALSAARQPVVLAPDLIHLVTTSVGLAVAADELASAVDLAGQAERAADQVRRGGGGWFAFAPRDGRSGLHDLVLARDLRRAVESDQLELSFQAMRRRAATADRDRLEAMVRWRHPVRGSQRPVSFVPALIGAGLALDFVELVLTRVGRAASEASAASGRPTTVSVDLDVALVDRPGEDDVVPELVARVLGRLGLAPSQLMLELDLGQLAGASPSLAGALSRLALLGVGLAADHVEPSLAALHLLQAWPVLGIWKLDRSVAEALDPARAADPARSALARAGAVAMVAAAGSAVEVAAQGVEGPEAAMALEDLGVHLLQGRYLSQPQLHPER